MEPNTRNSAGYSKPIPSYQNSGTLVQNKIWKRVREWKSQLIVSGVVVIFAVLSLLNETLDLPHLLANAPRTPVNWAEIALDVIALFLVGFISIFLLSLVESRRRRAEEVLRENQKKHRAIFNAARDGIVLIESETGQIVDCNPEFENLTGRRLENLKEMKIWELRPTEKVEKTKKKFFEIKVNGSGGSAELELEKPDGKIIHVEFLSKALRIRGKQYIQNVVRDITERKRAEEALQSEKGRLQALMEGLARTGIGIDVVGTDYKVVFQNQTLRERFGDLTGKLCYENYMGLKRPCDFCPMLKAIRNNKVESVELKAADGTNYELISAPFPNPDGTVDKVIEVVMDITERKKAEDALRESEERYRRLFEGTSEGILVADIETKMFKYANPALCKMLGYGPKELRQMGMVDLHPKENLEHVISEFEAQARGDKTLAPDIPCLHKDGTTIFADVNTTRILIDGKGCNVGFFTDVTERRKMEAQLIQAERLTAVGTLAYGIAHEFNNILAGILGNAEFGMGSGDSKEVEGCFRVIMENCDRAGSITNSLLTLARQRQVKKEVADLTDAVENVVGLVERELEKQNIRVDLKFKPVPEIVCDLGELSEVFLNMITNARDAMKPDGGALTIELRKRNDNIEIIFADTGGGIPDEIKGRIFEPFVTTKGALGQSEIPGTGLGLFFSIGIISRYHGKIEVESKVGKGSKFTIKIPVTQNQQLPDRAEAEDEGPTVLPPNLNILLVDDEEAICNVVKKFLEEKGYSVVDTTSGKKGLKLFKDKSFDLVLSDITMPDMDGVKLISELKSIDPAIKLVTLTGHVAEKKLEAARKAGADQILLKPFKKEDLYRAIGRALSV